MPKNSWMEKVDAAKGKKLEERENSLADSVLSMFVKGFQAAHADALTPAELKALKEAAKDQKPEEIVKKAWAYYATLAFPVGFMDRRLPEEDLIQSIVSEIPGMLQRWKGYENLDTFLMLEIRNVTRRLARAFRSSLKVSVRDQEKLEGINACQLDLRQGPEIHHLGLLMGTPEVREQFTRPTLVRLLEHQTAVRSTRMGLQADHAEPLSKNESEAWDALMFLWGEMMESSAARYSAIASQFNAVVVKATSKDDRRLSPSQVEELLETEATAKSIASLDYQLDGGETAGAYIGTVDGGGYDPVAASEAQLGAESQFGSVEINEEPEEVVMTAPDQKPVVWVMVVTDGGVSFVDAEVVHATEKVTKPGKFNKPEYPAVAQPALV